MEKKRSVGKILWHSIVWIILMIGIFFLSYNQSFYHRNELNYSTGMPSHKLGWYTDWLLMISLMIASSIVYIIVFSAFHKLDAKKLARIGLILSLVGLLGIIWASKYPGVFIVKLAVLFSFITGVALLSSSLVKKFITRPKVKEQFK